MQQGFARLKAAAILDSNFQASIQGAGSEPSQVRRHDYVVQLQNIFIGGNGLRCKHI